MRIILILFVLLFSQAKAQTQSNTLLWEVSGHGLKKPSYLYGTYHLLRSSIIDEYPEVKRALKKSKTVVVETELDSSKMMALSAQMLSPDGPTWAQKLSSTESNQLDSMLRRYFGAELSQLSVLRPAAINTMLAMGITQEALSDTLPDFKGPTLDQWFAAQGKKNKRTLVSLETLEEQFAILYTSTTTDSQLVELKYSLKDIHTVGPESRKLCLAYLKQDLAELEKIARSYSEKHGSLEALLDDRNKKWMQVLPKLMTEQPTFIAVGALHLPGEQGLIAMLRAQGYTVKAVKNRAKTDESGIDAAVILLLLLPAATSGIEWNAPSKNQMNG